MAILYSELAYLSAPYTENLGLIRVVESSARQCTPFSRLVSSCMLQSLP